MANPALVIALKSRYIDLKETGFEFVLNADNIGIFSKIFAKIQISVQKRPMILKFEKKVTVFQSILNKYLLKLSYQRKNINNQNTN